MPPITVRAEIAIPRVPNFLRTPSGTIPVHAVPDDDLRRIGREWTEDLLARAHAMRAALQATDG